jgi:hypothetical protein
MRIIIFLLVMAFLIIGCGGRKYKIEHGSDGLTWDGYHMWSCDDFLDRIYKLAADGSMLMTYEHPCDPTGLAWDGKYLWSCSARTGSIYKHKIDETLSVVKVYKSPSTNPTGLAWDGRNLWSCDADSDKIYKHNMDETLSVAEVYDAPSNIPKGLAWDGKNLWSANGGVCYSYHTRLIERGSVEIYKHNMDNSLSVAKTYKLKNRAILGGLTWDGKNIWNGGPRVLIKTTYK